MEAIDQEVHGQDDQATDQAEEDKVPEQQPYNIALNKGKREIRRPYVHSNWFYYFFL